MLPYTYFGGIGEVCVLRIIIFISVIKEESNSLFNEFEPFN